MYLSMYGKLEIRKLICCIWDICGWFCFKYDLVTVQLSISGQAARSGPPSIAPTIFSIIYKLSPHTLLLRSSPPVSFFPAPPTGVTRPCSVAVLLGLVSLAHSHFVLVKGNTTKCHWPPSKAIRESWRVAGRRVSLGRYWIASSFYWPPKWTTLLKSIKLLGNIKIRATKWCTFRSQSLQCIYTMSFILKLVPGI